MAGDIVVTMLPAGPQVRAVYLGPDGIIAKAKKGALLIDCSTIDVETARLVAEEAKKAGFEMLDAPVSGGVMGAQAGTLTFMVGGTKRRSRKEGRFSPIWAARSFMPARRAAVRSPRSATT
jgi:3-hydroxyisobutyrate dehydrogenase